MDGEKQRCCESAQCPSPPAAGEGICRQRGGGQEATLAARPCCWHGKGWQNKGEVHGWCHTPEQDLTSKHRGLLKAQSPHQAAGQSRERLTGTAPTREPSSTAEHGAGPGPNATVWHTGPALAQSAAAPNSSPSPQALRCDLRRLLPRNVPSHPSLPAHPRHRSATPAGEGVPSEHGGVTMLVGTQQKQGGSHCVTAPPRLPGPLAHLHLLNELLLIQGTGQVSLVPQD